MPKCPHCGEQVHEGQETCFACGWKIRARAYQHEKPHNVRVFILAGVLLLAGVVGVIAVIAAGSRKAKVESVQQRQAEIRDSVRQAMKAKRDTIKVESENAETRALADELDKLERRFDNVRQQVVRGDKPGPEQAKAISQIRTELSRLRGIVASIELESGVKAETLKQEVRDGERTIRALISDLGRAPKN